MGMLKVSVGVVAAVAAALGTRVKGPPENKQTAVVMMSRVAPRKLEQSGGAIAKVEVEEAGATNNISAWATNASWSPSHFSTRLTSACSKLVSRK